MTKQCSLIVVPSGITLHTTLHALKSSESIRQQADADELATGCTVGEQLPWQQQMSQLWWRKIKQSEVSGERDTRLRLMIWVHWAMTIVSCHYCNAAGAGIVTQAASPHTHLAVSTSSAPCLHGVCRTSLQQIFWPAG